MIMIFFPPPPPIKKPRRKVYLYHKGDYESMRKDAFEFAKERKILETSIGTSIVRKKDNQGIAPLKRRGGTGITASEIEQAEEFNGQFTDVFNKNDHSEVPFLSRSAPFMDVVVSNEDVTKLLKG